MIISLRFRLVHCSALLLAACPETFAGTLDLTLSAASQELFRGIVQNNGLTGSVRADYRLANRVYFGSRMLNNRSAGDLQTDAYAGYARSLALFDLVVISIDGGISASFHTGDRNGPLRRDLDWAEAYASVNSGPARFSLAFAPDYFGSGAAAWRAAGQLRLPISAALDATAVLGWNGGDGVGRYLAWRGGLGDGYADYSVMLSLRLPGSFSTQFQVGGSSVKIDGSSGPRALVGIRWSWGRQFP